MCDVCTAVCSRQAAGSVQVATSVQNTLWFVVLHLRTYVSALVACLLGQVGYASFQIVTVGQLRSWHTQ